ncbi:unnamed protein product [Rotaria sp. Silwood1]|nr:unnamed protein product [Rotaria sp. Silwood1]
MYSKILITTTDSETHNVILAVSKKFPIGLGKLIITGTGGLNFEEKRDIIVYDNCHVILVQTSSSTYRPHDTMEIRVVVTNENLIPIEYGELIVEIYDAVFKLVGEFPNVPIHSGLTKVLRYPLAEHVNVGTWLVSATIGNTTSSIEVIVSCPLIPSFDVNAIFQRFLLRIDETLRGVIKINDDHNEPIFGRAIIAIAGRIELNYDLLSLFNIDITKAIYIQVYIQVTDLISGQDRIIHYMIPIFTHDILYDIRPLEFEIGVKNEFQIIAKRPDGKPIEMKNIIVTGTMIMDDEYGKKHVEEVVEIKDFCKRDRNDIGFFNLEIPKNCIGVLMAITSLGEDGKMRHYRIHAPYYGLFNFNSHALPFMPKRRRHGAKLSIELLPSTVAPFNTNDTDVNVPVISSPDSTVGRTSNFYIQLIPSKSVENFERLLMSYVIMTNGRITFTGKFYAKSIKECPTTPLCSIKSEEEKPLVCVFKGILPILITLDMMPYSTLLVYTFQPTFDFYVVESYRFSVADLFQSSLKLNATIVPFMPTEKIIENDSFMKEMNVKPIYISNKIQEKTRVELSFTGVPGSTVGLNVFEYDASYTGRDLIRKMIFGVNSSSYDLSVVEGDDIYITSNMEQFYDDEQIRRSILSSSYKFGTSLWFNKMNSKLYNISQEAFTFMRSGLTIISDFEWLRIPKDIEYENLSKLFWKFDEKLTMFMNGYTFNIRDEARQLLEEYIIQADLSMIPPSITLKDQSHMSYYRSVFFNTSDIKSEGIDKVLLPRIKPYSIWLATGIALNKKSGLSIAQPIYLPNNTGLFVLGNCPKQVNIDEHALLTYGINNYLGKDLTNVMLRIRTSSDFELFEESKPEHVVSSIDKNYTLTIPLLKSFGVETPTAFNYFIKRYTTETNTLVGIDSVIVCLYRLLGLRHYLREIMQTELPIFDMAADNIGKAYQTLQLYNNNDGSYSFISDKGTQYSSLYLTSLAFGAMISPMMSFRDNVTLNRTLNWILSHQEEDGSFNDNDPFFSSLRILC